MFEEGRKEEKKNSNNGVFPALYIMEEVLSVKHFCQGRCDTCGST